MKDFLILLTKKPKPKGWRHVPRELLEKIGYQETALEVPQFWLYNPKKQKENKRRNKNFTLKDILPTS